MTKECVIMLGYSQLENILKDTEVTLMTKKNKKEIPVLGKF